MGSAMVALPANMTIAQKEMRISRLWNVYLLLDLILLPFLPSYSLSLYVPGLLIHVAFVLAFYYAQRQSFMGALSRLLPLRAPHWTIILSLLAQGFVVYMPRVLSKADLLPLPGE